MIATDLRTTSASMPVRRDMQIPTCAIPPRCRGQRPSLSATGSGEGYRGSSRLEPLLDQLAHLLADTVSRAIERLLTKYGSQTDAKGTTASGGPKKPRPLEHSEGFLWKPTSEKDKNLVILLPPHLNGEVKSLKIKSPDGKQLATGKFSGIANGERSHFRFSKPGNEFPKGSVVEILLKDGSIREVKVDRPGQRFEGKIAKS